VWRRPPDSSGTSLDGECKNGLVDSNNTFIDKRFPWLLNVAQVPLKRSSLGSLQKHLPVEPGEKRQPICRYNKIGGETRQIKGMGHLDGGEKLF